MIFTTLGKLITDLTHTVSQLSGPVGIYTVTAQVTQSGSISTLLSLTALLSTNIGMFNLLPIPGLDGSQVLFALVEKIIRREIPTKMKYALQMAGPVSYTHLKKESQNLLKKLIESLLKGYLLSLLTEM